MTRRSASSSDQAGPTPASAHSRPPISVGGLRRSVVYGLSGIPVRALSLMTGLVLRRWIAPAQFGAWSLTQVIVDFVSKLDLGADASLMRNLPLERGRGAETLVRGFHSSAMFAALAQGILGALGVVIYWLFVTRDATWDNGLVWVGAAVILASRPIVTIGTAVVTSHGRFEHAGALGIMVSVVTTTSWLIGGWLSGVYGLIVGAVVASAIAAIVTMAYLERLNLGPRLREASWAVARRLLGFGIPLRAADFSTGFFLTVDAVAVAALFQPAALALYSTATLAVGAVSEFVGRLTLPERNEWRVEVGRHGTTDAVARGVSLFFVILALGIWPPVAVATYLGVQIITHVVMPSYGGLTPILRVLLVAWVALPQAYGIRDLWVIEGNFRAIFLSGLVGLATFGGLLLAAAHRPGFEPLWVAWIYLVSGAILMVALLATAGRRMWGRWRTAGHLCLLVAAGAVTWIAQGVATLPVNWGFSTGLGVAVKATCSAALIVAPSSIAAVLLATSIIGPGRLLGMLKKGLAGR